MPISFLGTSLLFEPSVAIGGSVMHFLSFFTIATAACVLASFITTRIVRFWID